MQDSAYQEARDHQQIANFITAVHSKNPHRIAKFIHFRSIGATDEKDFVQRFDGFFDDTLMNNLVSSDPKTDWCRVGWRGVMFDNGALWLDDDGKVVAINHETAAQKAIRAKRLADHKAILHPRLVGFQQPVHLFETKTHVVRIDRLKSGTYRYASWKKTKNKTKKMRQEWYWRLNPDLVLNGKRVDDGSGGNHRYVFKSGAYTYVYETGLGVCSDESEGPYLEVLKDKKSLLKEQVVGEVQWS
jgi:hypothetical protein